MYYFIAGKRDQAEYWKKYLDIKLREFRYLNSPENTFGIRNVTIHCVGDYIQNQMWYFLQDNAVQLKLTFIFWPENFGDNV